jgi:aerobic-type carbon monoxide dehydrogenase small subunit (CoxS/CutS family)
MLKVLSVKEVELLKAVLEETKNEFEKKFGSLLQQAGADTVTVEKSESNEIENTPAKDL